jgi:murein DD-endopeptidase MepM/ murein hydrolase activator NlpD
MIRNIILTHLICYASFGFSESLSMAMPMIQPVRGEVSSEFGYRESPFTQHPSFHQGIDIMADLGTPIIAPASGSITAVGYDAGLGRYIIMAHKGGVVTRYGHLSKIKVKKGQKVKRGVVIGSVGTTGRTTGPHLHYDVAIKGKYVDPRKFLIVSRRKKKR